MMKTEERLVSWMAEEKCSGKRLAQELRCSQSFVSHLRIGRKKPSRRVANLIERLSATWEHGPIRAMEWDQ